jgi:hypothetical protein
LRTKSECILVLVKRVKERTFQKFVFLNNNNNNNDITTSQNGGFLILQARKERKRQIPSSLLELYTRRRIR